MDRERRKWKAKGPENRAFVHYCERMRMLLTRRPGPLARPAPAGHSQPIIGTFPQSIGYESDQKWCLGSCQEDGASRSNICCDHVYLRGRGTCCPPPMAVAGLPRSKAERWIVCRGPPQRARATWSTLRRSLRPAGVRRSESGCGKTRTVGTSGKSAVDVFLASQPRCCRGVIARARERGGAAISRKPRHR